MDFNTLCTTEKGIIYIIMTFDIDYSIRCRLLIVLNFLVKWNRS